MPKSIQLLAGQTGQQYNQRKKRKGAFREDRYLYIGLNMVRAGVVSHPEQWDHGGYNEIQNPRRKNSLIDYETLEATFWFHEF